MDPQARVTQAQRALSAATASAKSAAKDLKNLSPTTPDLRFAAEVRQKDARERKQACLRSLNRALSALDVELQATNQPQASTRNTRKEQGWEQARNHGRNQSRRQVLAIALVWIPLTPTPTVYRQDLGAEVPHCPTLCQTSQDPAPHVHERVQQLQDYRFTVLILIITCLAQACGQMKLSALCFATLDTVPLLAAPAYDLDQARMLLTKATEIALDIIFGAPAYILERAPKTLTSVQVTMIHRTFVVG
ncbi:MAG: hypothetical protein MMC23_004996 [Stictis urceolatum]|nr:hypothetical protein [Stictis urceolata]